MTFADRDGWRLRIFNDIDMGTWSVAAGGTLMRAMRPSDGGRRDGKGKRLVDRAKCSPLGSILDNG